jgi:hypothetical protein
MLAGGCPVYAGLPALLAPLFQWQSCGRSSPYLLMFSERALAQEFPAGVTTMMAAAGCYQGTAYFFVPAVVVVTIGSREISGTLELGLQLKSPVAIRPGVVIRFVQFVALSPNGPKRIMHLRTAEFQATVTP